METVTSRDGTRIAYSRRGYGTPLVLVHGAMADSSRWSATLPALEKNFSVYALDRRGHGESGDAEAYALEREFEDIAAVLQAAERHTGEPADLLGHSFGSLCSLEAALLMNVHRLVLYEPPTTAILGGKQEPVGIIERLDDLLEAGDREGVLKVFLLDAVRMPPQEFDYYRTLPPWPARVAVAHTLPRELRALENYQFDPERFKNLQVPTLLLLGGDSPQSVKQSTYRLNEALPHSLIKVLAGQQHVAMDTAPELFLNTLREFLVE